MGQLSSELERCPLHSYRNVGSSHSIWLATMTHDSCRASCGKVSRLGEWKFEDPFKATYPNKTPPWRDPQEERHLQKFFELYNNYDANSLQPRYQFTQNNKMIWVSSDSSIPKRYRKGKRKKSGSVAMYTTEYNNILCYPSLPPTNSTYSTFFVYPVLYSPIYCIVWTMQVCHCDTQVVVCVVREDGWTKITETYQTHTEKEITLLLTTDTIWTNVSIDARLRNIPKA